MSAAYLFAGLLLLALGSIAAESTRLTRGKGSWAEDRRRLMVAGALYAVAGGMIGLAIAEGIAP